MPPLFNPVAQTRLAGVYEWSVLCIISGIKDMIPEPTEDSYEGFDALAEKTNSWLANQPPSITVLNMQSVMAMLNEGRL